MKPNNIEKLEYIRYVLHTIQDDLPAAENFVYTDFVNREDVPSAVGWKKKEQKKAIELASQFAYELLDEREVIAEMIDL